MRFACSAGLFACSDLSVPFTCAYRSNGLKVHVELSHRTCYAKCKGKLGKWVLRVHDEKTGDCFEDRYTFLLDATTVESSSMS